MCPEGSARSVPAADLPCVDRRPVARRWNGLSRLAGSVEPRGLRLLDLGECLLGRGAECRASVEVRNIGDVAAVLRAVEDVDVVVGQGPSLLDRAYRSTRRRNWRIW
jgi:hypothetical protein